MLVSIIWPVVVAGIIFGFGEWWRRRAGAGNEVSRKLVHALHGLVIMAWLALVPHEFIIWFEAAFFVAMFGVRHVALSQPRFAWLHRVGRVSWGEFFYPLGVIGAIWLADAEWMMIAAVAQLALADAAAALIGKSYGAGNTYRVFGIVKSWAGTAGFVVVSALIAAVCLLALNNPTSAQIGLLLIVLPLVLAAVENIGWRGTDNFLLPVVAVWLLNLIA